MRWQWPIAGRGPGVFSSVFSASLAGFDTPGNFTVCEVFTQPFIKSGSQVRLTLQGSTPAFSPTEMWMGHAPATGNPYDFDGTQVQVKVAGATAFALPVNGSVVTDAIPYNFVASKNFVIAFFAGGACPSGGPGAGVVNRYYVGGNTAAVAAKAAGYTTDLILDAISKIEVFG